MIQVLEINEICLPNLATMLSTFEKQFTYPLGAGRQFSISHGDDYTLFFRSIGTSVTFIAIKEAIVAGIISVALKTIYDPSGQNYTAAYICDLKIDQGYRKSLVLKKLLQKAQEWITSRCDKAFCVVMDGTNATPDRYTGRTDIPRFEKLASIVLLRIPTSRLKDDRTLPVEASTDLDLLKDIVHYSRGSFIVGSGSSQIRSQLTPCYLAADSHLGNACGILEDTRLAKRLICDDGKEMSVGHLASFAYDTIEAGIMIIQVALDKAYSLRIPALFVSIPLEAAPDYMKGLSFCKDEIVCASASVYGVGFSVAENWFINSSEI